MDRTAAQRMRRYRVKRAYRAMVRRALKAGLSAAHLKLVVEDESDAVEFERSDQGLRDIKTIDLFERNADRGDGRKAA